MQLNHHPFLACLLVHAEDSADDRRSGSLPSSSSRAFKTSAGAPSTAPSLTCISRGPIQMRYQKTPPKSRNKKKIADLKKSRINLLRNRPFWIIMVLSDR